MSLLTICQQVAVACNKAQPTVVMSSTDPDIILMRQCVQDIGDELVERWGWQNLKIQQPVTFVGDGVTATFPLPTFWGTLGPSDIFVSSAYPTLTMPGPTNEEDLLRMKALPVVVQPSCWRVVENSVEFFPVLALGEVVSYVFAKNNWITNLNGTPYPNSVNFDTPRFQQDSDLTVFRERLIYLGSVALWKRRKGFDYAEELEDYELALDRIAGQESTMREIRMSRDTHVVGDTWFPGTITDLTNQP